MAPLPAGARSAAPTPGIPPSAEYRDYYGTGTSDILFRNNSTGDTWYAAMSNGGFAGWHQVGGSDTTYGVKI